MQRFLEVFHDAKDKHLITKFTFFEAMKYAVSAFNQFFNNQGLILQMKKYYFHQSRHVSTKEFKILHVPIDMSED